MALTPAAPGQWIPALTFGFFSLSRFHSAGLPRNPCSLMGPRKVATFLFVCLFCWYKNWYDSFQTLYILWLKPQIYNNFLNFFSDNSNIFLNSGLVLMDWMGCIVLLLCILISHMSTLPFFFFRYWIFLHSSNIFKFPFCKFLVNPWIFFFFRSPFQDLLEWPRVVLR